MADWEDLRRWAETILNVLRFGASLFRRRKDSPSVGRAKPANESTKPQELTEIEETSQTLIRIERVELVVQARKHHRGK